MGNPKQKWTAEEEDALRAGIAKYGPGKWKFIQRDPEFNQHLHCRSNIDLKDKWRNMCAVTQGPREKFRTPKAKAFQDPTVVPSPDMQTYCSDVPVAHELPADESKEDPSKELNDSKNDPRYNEMIFEALSNTKEDNGMDITQLIAFIKQRAELPPTSRKLLGSRLRRLVITKKLEKVDNCYRIRSNSAPTPPVKENQPKQAPIPDRGATCESLEAVSKDAASLIADAENKSAVADIAVKEAERILRKAEEGEALLLFAQEIFEKCNEGEVVFLG